MRARRLAKLASSGASAGAPTQSDASSSSAGEQSTSKGPGDNKENAQSEEQPARVQINITPAPSSKPPQTVAVAAADTPTAASDAPLGPAGNGIKESPTPAIRTGIIIGTNKRPIADIDPASASPAPATEAPARRPHVETLEEWTDHTLSSLFRVTVDPNRTKDRHGHQLTFLPGLSQDIQERQQPLLLSTDDLDPAIVEAGTAVPHKKPLLDYLLPCWKNVMRAVKQQRDTRPERVEVLQEAKRLCMSNCIFALTMPEYFG